jgi:YegS/Rv2252/BmrU family lipid kinase
VRIVECHSANGGKEVAKRVRAAVRDGAEIVAVAGGDGAMARAVQELAHRRTILGVIPLGTGNSFARSLGIGVDFDAAVRTIALGEPRKVDLGIVNGCYFANFAAIGVPAEIAAATPKLLKRLAGTLSYVLAGVFSGLKSKPFEVEIQADKNCFGGRVHQVIVVSGSAYGDHPILPEASIVSGRLAVFTTTNGGAAGIAKDYIAIERGRQTDLPEAHWWIAKRAKVKTTGAQPLEIDGRVIGKTPAKFKIDPRALRVLVPPEFDATG